MNVLKQKLYKTVILHGKRKKIDKSIADSIIWLNANGFSTICSCSGTRSPDHHYTLNYWNSQYFGYIVFRGLSEEQLVQLLECGKHLDAIKSFDMDIEINFKNIKQLKILVNKLKKLKRS